MCTLGTFLLWNLSKLSLPSQDETGDGEPAPAPKKKQSSKKVMPALPAASDDSTILDDFLDSINRLLERVAEKDVDTKCLQALQQLFITFILNGDVTVNKPVKPVKPAKPGAKRKPEPEGVVPKKAFGFT